MYYYILYYCVPGKPAAITRCDAAVVVGAGRAEGNKLL